MRSPLVRWCPPAITLVLMLGCLVGCGTAESTTRAAGTATRVVIESADVGTPPAPPIPSDSLPSSDAPPPTDAPPGGAPTANTGPGPAPGGSSGTGAGGRTPGPDGDCPDLPSATSSAVAVDYVDLVQWQGRTYYAAGVYGWPAPSVDGRLAGSAVFVVRCRISGVSDRLQVAVPIAERDATQLPAGTPVHAAPGWPTTCLLMARPPEGPLRAYRAIDPRATLLTPIPCAPSSGRP